MVWCLNCVLVKEFDFFDLTQAYKFLLHWYRFTLGLSLFCRSRCCRLISTLYRWWSKDC